jgi:hypothetical protein
VLLYHEGVRFLPIYQIAGIAVLILCTYLLVEFRLVDFKGFGLNGGVPMGRRRVGVGRQWQSLKFVRLMEGLNLLLVLF